jgi:1,4-dihydroxy-2-naphthoate octaprenyltransferase
MRAPFPWKVALDPAIYTAAVIPVFVGTAIAWREISQIDILRFGLCLIGVVLLQVWINFTNDVFDAQTGVDRNKVDSLVNLTGNPSLIFWLGTLALVVGYLCLVGINSFFPGYDLLIAGTIGIFLGYSYQGPPFRLAYRGWGELFSFICFGPLSVLVANYSQRGNWSLTAFKASLVVGFFTSLILYTHHFPQVENDRAFGKLTPVVRWGTLRAARRIIFLVAIPYLLCIWFGLQGDFPLWTGLVFFTLPLTVQLVQRVNDFHDQPSEVAKALPMAVGIHFLSGVLLALGFVLPG